MLCNNQWVRGHESAHQKMPTGICPYCLSGQLLTISCCYQLTTVSLSVIPTSPVIICNSGSGSYKLYFAYTK